MLIRVPSPGVALVFAGGSGVRMDRKDNLPKQFIEVDGVPILVHTLRRFQECAAIDLIYIVVGEAWIDHVDGLVASYGISKVAGVTAGGVTALDSIFNGLQKMYDDGVPKTAIVAIHDGVRPIINVDLVTANIEMARRDGNAITSIPAFETVALKNNDDDTVETVVDRHRAYVLQAPQTFVFEDVYNINVRAKAEATIDKFVDQANMQAYYGKTLHLLDGFRGNVKITIPDDVRYFNYLVETGEYDRIISGHQAVNGK